jgi:hypothetical protein
MDLAQPRWEYSPAVRALVEAVRAGGLLVAFDWREWQREGLRYVEDPRRVATADLDIILRLLTLHVRKDEEADGHLARVLEEGHIVAVLRRLRELIPAGPSTTS